MSYRLTMPTVSPERHSKAVVLVSGGLDSTTLLAWMRFHDCEVLPISFNYGQRHIRELESMFEVLKHYNCEHREKVIHLGDVATSTMQGSSQTSNDVDVPLGHYTDESMKATVVPNRNMIMLAIATAYAVQEKANLVCYAPHQGDHAIYPDCRAEFCDALADAISLGNEGITLYTPFVYMTKTDIAVLAHQLHVPVEKTWSCYQGGEKHCGECGTCVERKESFSDAGLEDLTEYLV
jgi:7-cyano-7-deazaguanine synthase